MKYDISGLLIIIFSIILQSCSGGIPECNDVDEDKLKAHFISSQKKTFSDHLQNDQFNDEKSKSLESDNLELKRKEYYNLQEMKLDSISHYYSSMTFLEIIEISDNAGMLYHTCSCRATYNLNGKKDTIKFELAQSDDDFRPFISQINGKTIKPIIH